MIAIQAAFRSHWQSIHDYTAHRVLIHQDIGILVRTKFRYPFLFPSNERLIFFESFEQQMILHEAVNLTFCQRFLNRGTVATSTKVFWRF